MFLTIFFKFLFWEILCFGFTSSSHSFCSEVYSSVAEGRKPLNSRVKTTWFGNIIVHGCDGSIIRTVPTNDRYIIRTLPTNDGSIIRTLTTNDVSIRTVPTNAIKFDDLIVHGFDGRGGGEPSKQQPVKVGLRLAGDPETYFRSEDLL